jgi:hypothetical protein
MKVQVKVKVITENGKYALNEIKGLKEGEIVNGEYNRQNNSVTFKWHGNNSILFVGENCTLSKSSQSEIDRMNALDKVFVSDEIKNREKEYLCGAFKDKLVTLTYCNKRSNKETDRKMTYDHAFSLALNRALDGRYKNFNFIIE